MPNVCSRETNPCQEPDNSDQKNRYTMIVQVITLVFFAHKGSGCQLVCGPLGCKKKSTWEGNEAQLVQQLGCLMALCLFYKLVKKQHRTSCMIRTTSLASNRALTRLSTRDLTRATTWASTHASICVHCKYIQCNFYTFYMCPTFHCNLTVLK